MNEINEREKWRGENNFGLNIFFSHCNLVFFVFSLCKKIYFNFILIAF